MLAANLLDVLDVHAGAITAIATIALACANVVLATLTGIYVWVTRTQQSQLKEQTKLLRDRDDKAVKRAIQGIVTEIEMNANICASNTGHPFVVGVYVASLPLLWEVPMSPETKSAITQAHSVAQAYNAATAAGISPSTPAHDALKQARTIIPDAWKALEADQELQAYLTSG